jgi:hypothetical protein
VRIQGRLLVWIVLDPHSDLPEWFERLSPLKRRWLAFAAHLPVALIALPLLVVVYAFVFVTTCVFLEYLTL